MPKTVVAEVEVNGWKFERKEDGTVKMSFQFMQKLDLNEDFFTKDEWQEVVDAMRGEPDLRAGKHEALT